MVNSLIYIPLIVSFVVTLFVTPYWIKRASSRKLMSRDVHKHAKKAAELGGITIISGFIAGVLVYVAIDVFISDMDINLLHIFAALSAVLIAVILGFADDILGWKIGLRQFHKALLSLLIALPIIVINAGHSTITIPFMGQINIGLVYPLVLVPIGIAGAANGFNMIGGYNGLETGMGIIVLAALGFISWETGATAAAMLAFCMVLALVAFFIFNRYPAKIFPGDVMTYSVGTLIAIVAILGNIEKFALILFIPYFIELILKARGMMQKESFAKLKKDGSLDERYKKIYGLEHLAIIILKKMKKRVHETDVVLFVISVQLVFAVLAMLSFASGI